MDHFNQDPDNFLSMDREFANMTGGAVAEDFDGDGWVDLFVLRGGIDPNLLYMNQGDGTFVDQAALRGVGQTGRHAGVCGADYDSDGDVDLFVSGVDGPHLLLTNDGTGNFTVDPEAIPVLTVNSSSPSWADIDGDGLLDLALGSWTFESDGSIHLYRNRGKDGFALFQVIPMEWTFVPHFADLNGDGNVDLIAVADFKNTRFFLNDGRGIFLPAGGSDIENGMGVATADLDDDGDLDLFMTAIQHPVAASNTTNTNGNRLLLNDGHGKFTDITTDSGVRAGYWGWGAVFADLENDGDEDLFHVNGFATFVDLSGPLNVTPAVLFENEGSLNFTEVAAPSGDVADTGQGRCVVSFDYDNDGDLDLFITNNNEVQASADVPGIAARPGRLVLLRNDSSPVGNWLKVRIDGNSPHHAHGMGARVYAGLAGKTLMREINASSNYNGHGPYRIAHFGAGSATQFETIRVSFPNGDAVQLENVPVNQEVVIKSPRSLLGKRRVTLDGTITFEMPPQAIPVGGEAVWNYGGVEDSNPATFLFDTPGKQTVSVQIFFDSSRSELLRAESFQIEVIDPKVAEPGIARIWNEAALDAIRIDFPNPAVHARNLFHLSVSMWDVWAAYDPVATGYLHREFIASQNPADDRREAISYAAYRLLSARYLRSLHASASQLRLDFLMEDLGYPIATTRVDGDSPAALGNRVAATIIDWGASDGSLEENNYHNSGYRPANQPLVLANSGTILANPNRWQPLRFEVALSQNGLFTLSTQIYAGSQWGEVRPFALHPTASTYLDPGAPPQLGGKGSTDYKNGTLEVIRYSSWLDPDDGVVIDISPRSKGLNTLGQNDGSGHGPAPNPATGLPYEEQWAKRADYGRAIAEYWADGPDSETPPGHWNTLANEVSDHPELERRFRGQGEDMDRLEWDIKLSFALNSALHDAAVAAWGCKRFYDYVRPISSIRHLSGLGELPMVPGLVEKITATSSAPGQRHANLLTGGAAIGNTAILAWGGEPANPATEYTGSQWIRGEDWLPYQRDTFVTPAFAGYVSGHSAFSRAAAEVLAYFTGDPYFPGGLYSHSVPAGSLEFEDGPSTDLTLQWATYFDAADAAGLSRLYGGIHFTVDDGPGRIMGATAGLQALNLVKKYFDGSILTDPIHATLVQGIDGPALRAQLVRGSYFKIESSSDLLIWKDETPFQQVVDSEIVIPISASSDRSFYRIVQQDGP